LSIRGLTGDFEAVADNFTPRLAALREKCRDVDADAFFGFAPPDNQYLTGFMGSTSAVIVTEREALFLCDFRYTEQAGDQVQGYAVEEVAGSLVVRTGERLKSLGVRVAAFDPACLTVAQSTSFQSAFHGVLRPVSGLVASLRMLKSRQEIARIRAASDLAEGVLADLLATLAAGITESDLAARFEYEFKRRGAEGASFDTIALFEARSSMPHGKPTEAALERGDIVLLDLGCRKDGYCSDLTRTYAFGTMPGAWFEEIYQVTLAAQRAALEAVRPGVSCRDVDAVARGAIAGAGYGAHFGHGLGHGVGIEVHENPRLSAESDFVLQAFICRNAAGSGSKTW
jgi:Xaa-Pro aminopeptidase